jgi:hypothetical protein
MKGGYVDSLVSVGPALRISRVDRRRRRCQAIEHCGPGGGVLVSRHVVSADWG